MQLTASICSTVYKDMDCILYIQYNTLLINHLHIIAKNAHLPLAVLIGMSALIVANFNLLMNAWSVPRSLNVRYIVIVDFDEHLKISPLSSTNQ